MIAHPAVLVRGLRDVRLALAPHLPVTLLSPPGAALFAGCLWWRALIELAEAERAGVPGADILDCGDAPGRALEAMRAGQRCIVLAIDAPGRPAVAAIAAECGATLLATPPPAFEPRGPRDLPALAAWLRGDTRPALV